MFMQDPWNDVWDEPWIDDDPWFEEDLAERVRMDRLQRLTVTTFSNIAKAVMTVHSLKQFVTNMNLMFVEGVLHTTYYYSYTYDLKGSLKLLAIQFFCTYMLCRVPYMIGTILLFGLLTTAFSVFELFLEIVLLKFCLIATVKPVFGYDLPNFVALIYYWSVITFSCLFTHFFTFSPEDFPLPGLFLTSLRCMYNYRYDGNDIMGMVFLLCSWMCLKSWHFPDHRTFMRPDFQAIFGN